METEDARQQLLTRLQAQVADCRLCQHARYGVQGPPVYSGPATAHLMIVGQSPSDSDRQSVRLWSGPAGRRLLKWLEWAGLGEEALRTRHYLTAVTRCYPGRAGRGRGDRMPSVLERRLCAPYLQAELCLVAPRLLVPVGRVAVDAFGGRGRPLDALVGRAFYAEHAWIVPLPHPSGASTWLNTPAHQACLARALAILRELVQRLQLA